MSFQGEDRSVHSRRMSARDASIVLFLACKIGGTISLIFDPIVI